MDVKTEVSGTIYQGVPYLEYTANPKVLWCNVCKKEITKYYLAINYHYRTFHK